MLRACADAAGRAADRLLCLLTVGFRSKKWILAAALIGCAAFALPDGAQEPATAAVPALPQKELQKLVSENRKLKSSLTKSSISGVHIIIDTARNRLYLKDGDKIVLDAVCSTGNGKILRDVDNNREWEFQTPRGERRIIKKVHRPVWTKPDWAFVEEGEAIPNSFKERIEEDMLGDYAMHIGNSYMIHGTLYRRMLGRSVTHGCIRLGDADLEKVYKSSTVGTRVFIY